MASRVEFLQQRNKLKDEVTQFVTLVKKVSDNASDLHIINLDHCLQMLAITWSEYSNIKPRLTESDQDNDLEVESLEKLYYEYVEIAEDIIKEHKETLAPAQTKESDALTPIILRKPPFEVKLNVFDGTYNKWHEFRDTFNAFVHTNESIDTLQKFRYLRKHLSKKAARVIDSLEISVNNYQLAWELLNEKFENKRLLVQSEMQALFLIPKINEESCSLLWNLVGKVNYHLKSLKNLGEPVDSWHTLLIYLIADKLDSTTRREWEMSISNKTEEIPTFSEFFEFVIGRCLYLDMVNLQLSTENVQQINQN